MGGISIKKISRRKREWLESRNQKLKRYHSRIICKSRINCNHNPLSEEQVNNPIDYINDRKIYSEPAPEVLSFINNTDDTAAFFNRFLLELKKHHYNRAFRFDIKNVLEITIDSLMYILAITRNFKGINNLNYSFYGNQPLALQPKKLLNESGFYGYVYGDERHFKPNSNRIHILNGNTTDRDVAAYICDFIVSNYREIRAVTSPVYKVLIELMSNTVQHAYVSKVNSFKNHWYIYVEDLEDRFRLVFLDTGVGIPNTTTKRLIEPIFGIKDSKMILSALHGENRSETRQYNRGTGLPKVLDYTRNKYVRNFNIYSGKGKCVTTTPKNDIQLFDYKNDFEGTLYSWEIVKLEGDSI